jgi:hypothetical protein
MTGRVFHPLFLTFDFMTLLSMPQLAQIVERYANRKKSRQ